MIYGKAWQVIAERCKERALATPPGALSEHLGVYFRYCCGHEHARKKHALDCRGRDGNDVGDQL